ncbi:hypothetical protein pb186bvf_003046 [Paramecium bursaria]
MKYGNINQKGFSRMKNIILLLQKMLSVSLWNSLKIFLKFLNQPQSGRQISNRNQQTDLMTVIQFQMEEYQDLGEFIPVFMSKYTSDYQLISFTYFENNKKTYLLRPIYQAKEFIQNLVIFIISKRFSYIWRES